MRRQTIHFIVNPASASGQTGKRWPQVAPLVFQQYPDANVTFTEYGGHAKKLATQCVKAGVDQIVAVGGDGTVHEVLNGLFDQDGTPLNPNVILSALPMGTGSDLCRSLGLPRDPKEAILSLKDTPYTVDVGWMKSLDKNSSFKGEAFLNVASLGLSGEVARHFEEHGKGGQLSYLKGIFTASRGYQNQPLHIRYQDQEQKWVDVHQKTYVCAVGNAQYFGGGMHIAPDAKLNDGVFQLVMIGDLSLLDILRYLPNLYQGTHLKYKKFHGVSTSCVEVYPKEDTSVWIEVDGEPSIPLPARFELKPQVLKMTALSAGCGIE